MGIVLNTKGYYLRVVDTEARLERLLRRMIYGMSIIL